MRKLPANVRVSELIDVIDRLVDIHTTASISDAFLTDTFNELKESFKKLVIAVNQDYAVSDFDKADKERNLAVRQLYNVINGYYSVPIEDHQPTAKIFMDIFQRYGLKILKEPYAVKSGLINSLLSDIRAEMSRHDISQFYGFYETVDNLNTKQNEFDRIRRIYDTSPNKKGQIISATKLKKPIIDAINQKLISYLTAMSVADAKKYKKFTDGVSGVIDSTISSIKKRSSKSEIEKTPSTPKENVEKFLEPTPFDPH